MPRTAPHASAAPSEGPTDGASATDAPQPVPAPAADPAPGSGDAASTGVAADAGTPAAGPDEAEARRLAAVRSTGLIGVEAGERIDRIARRASQIAGAPMALVSLIDEHGQWNPGVSGEGAPREAPRAFSMCSAAITTPEPFVIPDASKDPRWSSMEGVATAPGVRFYAGQPIDDGDGNLIGVLCVIDVVPREADAELLQALADLAVWARHELLAGRPATPGPSRAAAAPSPATERTAADAAATTDRLEELERLQSLVVSTTAHELRTPLTVLRVHADLLAAAAEDLGPDERASLEAITRAVTRLQDVSDGLVADLRGSAGGAEEALRRWLQLEQGSQRVRPGND
ncbi:GAF domain-containing protein [Patulibacter sp.]|uniref:sensor histidine kinase n=1 Tax=Patulibacter sp. TaxID=1912859 RepID=UPI00271D3100|nr:GAF domain-containing protein [Patulibacter sp.]MDO9410468.1 GAF domain-containing protein [Patulibacter sp.]